MELRPIGILRLGRKADVLRATDRRRPRRVRAILRAEALEGRELLAVDFTGPQAFSIPAVTTHIRVADFNRDARPDLLALTSTTATVVLNNGTGSFTTSVPVTIPAGFRPVAATVADLNRDGQPDVVLGLLNATDQLYVQGIRNNNATFTTAFAAPLLVNAGPISGPVEMSTGDYNRDGKPDVALAYNLAGGTRVDTLAGDGTGALGPALLSMTTVTGQNPAELLTEDFNVDAAQDLAVLTTSGLTILLNNTTATPFPATAPAPVSAGTNPNSMAAADINFDGKPDIAVAAGDGVNVFLNNGTGGFSTPVNVDLSPASAGAKEVRAIDLNNDSRPDLIVINSNNQVSVLLNNTFNGTGPGTRLFQPAVNFNAGTNPTLLAAADISGIGRPSILAVNASPTNNLNILQAVIAQPITVRLQTSTVTSGLISNTVITNNNRPTFTGTASPNQPVVLLAQRQTATGGTPAAAMQVATATADANGVFSLTPTTALADGTYTFFVQPGNSAAVNPTRTQVQFSNGTANQLLIDTVSPKVTNATFDARAGVLNITFQDEASGLAQMGLTDLANYQFGELRRGTVRPIMATSITTTAQSSPTAGQTVTLLFNRRQLNRRRTYQFLVRHMGITDVAGNQLAGQFNGTFPSGANGQPADFLITFSPPRRGR
ncbi:MAG: VCBS repeat-containing protein [Isosphaeraceae bacterium]|nr:VCBS repeat-containing protein [Isosphaeraceae bacterium]